MDHFDKLILHLDYHQAFATASDFLATTQRPLIVIVGPTASGKTDASIDLAMALRKQGKKTEIINADSRQLYRGMDIGTGKISGDAMDGIPHHLFSVLDPKEGATIAWYQKAAKEVIQDIHARDAVPLLVGGSMLYVSSIVDGLQPIAPADPALRAELMGEYDRDGGFTLHKKLREADPESAQSIPRENKVYVIRALEIFQATGKTKSALKTKKKSPYDLLIFGMAVPRQELKQRIGSRIESMFAAGWVDEVRALLQKGYGSQDPGFRSLGYREIAEALQQGIDPRSLMEVIEKKTLQYAKKQMTWWRRDERIRWFKK